MFSLLYSKITPAFKTKSKGLLRTCKPAKVPSTKYSLLSHLHHPLFKFSKSSSFSTTSSSSTLPFSNLNLLLNFYPRLPVKLRIALTKFYLPKSSPNTRFICRRKSIIVFQKRAHLRTLFT